MGTKRTRPRPWSTGDAGSFAQRTLAVRVPQILDDTIARAGDAGILDAASRAALFELRTELVSGMVQGLSEDARAGVVDVAAWNAACAPFVSKSWLDVPWYFAESYFYRRVLEATGYFREASAMRGVDPFLPSKLGEEHAALPRARAVLERNPRPRLGELLALSLWGNRADLSYAVGLAHGAHGAEEDLLVDDAVRAVALLGAAKRIAVLLDNAGTELAFDLVLADALARDVERVTLFAKSHPFFVSDATPADVERTRVSLAMDFANIDVVAHPYLTSSGFFFRDEMPRDLVDQLASFDVVVVKGDANYRRLVGDAPWPHATPIDDAADFPAPFLALRTLKAEVAVGVPDDVASRARRLDADWLVSGRFGVVQVCASSGNGP
jgi:uncharacterized protein with ATP-grasp and redox domains